MARKNLSAQQAAAADRLLERAFPDARQASRRSVLRHALSLFNANGVEATTIDDLRKASGQSVGTIYHHFKNKEGVVAALFFTALDDQSRVIAEHIEGLTDGQAVIEALIACYTAWITAQPECAYFVFLALDSVAQGPHGAELLQRLKARYEPIDELLARDAAAGRILPLPADLIPSLVLGAAEFYARSWLAGRRTATPATHAQRFSTAAWRALTA
ncbi:TetR/AcrR family transcriptional regulator [Scleromatobacter humisilvae]|uniref:TetR/AcrR family transcriptional regulator n=1 Tax=Scleromatobacter humisilvae TaxID=2897159 RepID=A0A9X1YMS4_9BURK|nr:TetR/AcrR family transcriptional regulator [Scleromatobacter humisilvae]MCK9687232.1 TetR/AcrR family transcriptional regulator [Scleromatobacter humisilvae]